MGPKAREKKKGEDERTEVLIFASYARDDAELVNKFIDLFTAQLEPSKRYHYSIWHDGRIHVGSKWDAEIKRALRACDLGLLLISPSFLSSRYIRKVELPTLVGTKGKVVIPVMLKKVNLDLHDLQGLEEYQIFLLRGRNQSAKAFGKCTNAASRDVFVEKLFEQVEARLRDLN